MPVVAALLVPGSPLPFVQRNNPPWGRLASAFEAAGRALTQAAPETLIVYSTQWLAVLDQLWLTRSHMVGLHVDDNWHEYGDLPFDFRIDTTLTAAIVAATPAIKIRSKGVDYDGFPVDTGTIVANHYLNPASTRPLAVTSNNLYHDFATTGAIAEIAAREADKLGRKVAFIGVGGLSGSIFRGTMAIEDDRIANTEDDAWNRRMLDLMQAGKAEELAATCPDYARAARVDMGFKHCAFVLGGIGGRFRGATVHGYEPLYGGGGAVVEFKL